MPNMITSVASPPSAWTRSARATSIERRRADRAARPSITMAGTALPNRASTTMAASANHGNRNAAGRKTTVPIEDRNNPCPRWSAASPTSAAAAAYAALKNGAATRSTTIRPPGRARAKPGRRARRRGRAEAKPRSAVRRAAASRRRAGRPCARRARARAAARRSISGSADGPSSETVPSGRDATEATARDEAGARHPRGTAMASSIRHRPRSGSPISFEIGSYLECGHPGERGRPEDAESLHRLDRRDRGRRRRRRRSSRSGGTRYVGEHRSRAAATKPSIRPGHGRRAGSPPTRSQ